MTKETPDRKVNTDAKTDDDDVKRLPHERDESPDGHNDDARGVMKQAASDLNQGLVDTDLHGMRGQDAAVDSSNPGQARPRADADEGMRHQTGLTPPDGEQ